MTEFSYQDMFPLGKDDTEYRLITRDGITKGTFEGRDMTIIQPEALTALTEEAFRDVSHLYRTRHLESLGRHPR